MNPLNQDELFQNLSGFLKSKGIELREGSYAQGIQKSCNLLTDAINLGHQSFDRAKTEIDKKLDQMRQVIHEQTAPKAPPKAAAAPPRAAAGKTGSKSPKAAAAKRPKRAKGKK